jgi:hypothetical protein
MEGREFDCGRGGGGGADGRTATLVLFDVPVLYRREVVRFPAREDCCGEPDDDGACTEEEAVIPQRDVDRQRGATARGFVT